MRERLRRDGGFTLVELLVVIVILGLLSAVVVFSVRGLSDNGQASACAAERTTLLTAVNSAEAAGKGVLTDVQLKAAGYLATTPSHYQVTVVSGNAVLVADAKCTAAVVTTTAPSGVTTTVPAATTTTVAAPTTTTAVSNGVQIAAAAEDVSNPYYGEARLTVNNSADVTALTATITVARTTGVSYHGEYNTFWSGLVGMTNATGTDSLTYTFTLQGSQAIVAGSWLMVAEYDGTGTARVSAGDTWTVTTTSGGVTSTRSGTY